MFTPKRKLGLAVPPPITSAPRQAMQPRAPMRPMAATGAMPPQRMADGGMGAATDATGADPDNDGDGGGVKIDPSAVNYHDDAQSCQGCAHFSNGNCAVLQMQVSPDGGCNAFSSGGQDAGNEADEGDSSSTDQMGEPGGSGNDDNY